MSEREPRPAALRVPVSDVTQRASLVSGIPPSLATGSDVNGALKGMFSDPPPAAAVVARPVRVISDPPPDAGEMRASDAPAVVSVPPAAPVPQEVARSAVVSDAPAPTVVSDAPALTVETPASPSFPPERSSGNGYAALEVEPLDPLELADEGDYEEEEDDALSDPELTVGEDDDEQESEHVLDRSTPPPPPTPQGAPASMEPPEFEISMSQEPGASEESEDDLEVEAELSMESEAPAGVELTEDEDDGDDKRPSGEFEELEMEAESPGDEDSPVRRSLGPPPPPPPVGRLSIPEPPDLKALTRSARVQELRPSKPRTHPWWEVFFDDDYLRTVRPPTPEQVARQCDFLERRLRLKPGATLLDVGCGLGLPVIELTSRGYLGVGLDLSLAMLSRASEEAQSRGMRINFLHADMREMNFDGSFDAVTCLGTTLGYFEDEANRKVIERFHRALKPGGTLLLDVVNRDHVIRSQPNLVWFEGDGCICMEESEFNFFTSRLHVKRTVIIDSGKQLEHEYSLRLYSLHEIGHMLHSAGFHVLEVTGRDAVPGVFFGQESPNLMVVAERRPPDGFPKPESTGKFQALPE